MLLFLLTTLLLSLAFVGLSPVLKNLLPTKQQLKPSASLPYRILHTAEKDALSSITVTHYDDEPYTLLYENEWLSLKREGGTPVRIGEAYMQKILEAATVIAIEDTVTPNANEVQAHLVDMGLEPPRITVQIRYTNGHMDTLSFGDRVHGTTYYYYRWSGNEGIYMCDEGLYEAFEYTANNLLPVQQPLIEKSLVDKISIQTQGQDEMEITFATSTDGITSGMLLHPYAYPLDHQAAETLLSAVADFRLGTLLGENSAINHAEYGFDDPLAVVKIHQKSGAFGEIDETGALATYTADEQTVLFMLGRAEGDYFYTCLYEGKNYLVSKFLVEPFIKATEENVITRHPADMGADPVAALQMQIGGTVLDIRRQRTERVLPNNQLDTDAQGNILYDINVTINGKAVSEEAFDALMERLKAMEVSDEAPVEYSVGSGAPRWQMTLTTQTGASRTLSAYTLDSFFDALAVDGVVRHTVQAESLEIALADIASAAP